MIGIVTTIAAADSVDTGGLNWSGPTKMPSVDLDDSSALLDLMESSYEPRVMRVAEPSPRRKKR